MIRPIREKHGILNMLYEGMDESKINNANKTMTNLSSHLDGVRCVAFHPVESLVITGSEDRTLKLWNLEKAAVLRK